MKKNLLNQKKGFMLLLVRSTICCLSLFFCYFVFKLGNSYFPLKESSSIFIENKGPVANNILFKIGLFIHIYSFPIIMLLISGLIIFQPKNKAPKAHKLIGKLFILICLFLFTPSGIILSFWATGGLMATLNFSALAFFTAYFTYKAYTAIKKANITKHKRDIYRVYILLNSAIFMRLGIYAYRFIYQELTETSYLCISCLSWLLPILLFEFFLQKKSSANNTEL